MSAKNIGAWTRLKPSRLYDLDGESVTTRQLAERAGCPIATMTDRLRRHTPKKAVEMGPSGSTIGGANFALSINARRVKMPGDGKPVPSVPQWDRFKVKPGEFAPFFSAMKPGQYPLSSGTAIERACQDAE